MCLTVYFKKDLEYFIEQAPLSPTNLQQSLS